VFWGWLAKIAANKRGNVTTIVALSAVPLLLSGIGVLELTSISNDHAKLQAAVDAGALAGAGRLSVATGSAPTDTATTVTKQTAAQSGITSQVAVQVNVAQDNSAVTVVATTTHTPIVDLLGARTITVTAKAENMGSIPLCVLQTGGDKIELKDQARIRATGCAVHANGDIKVAGGAMIQSDRTQAVGTVSGPVSPAGFAGAMPIDDPFASLNLNPPLNCVGKPLKVVYLSGTTLPLLPGVHCEQYVIQQNATLVLMPGEHYFMNTIVANLNAQVTGDDVVLIFGSTGAINFADKAAVTLGARKSGPFAGFLFITSRDNRQVFRIGSDRVSKLLGTIYIPNAELQVDTTGSVAQDSAWSIIVASSIQLAHNPNLVINTGYVGSGVPVPDGVGPNRNNPVLAQ
jgi:hypothetical protein